MSLSAVTKHHHNNLFAALKEPVTVITLIYCIESVIYRLRARDMIGLADSKTAFSILQLAASSVFTIKKLKMFYEATNDEALCKVSLPSDSLKLD